MDKIFLTTSEAAEVLGISRAVLYRDYLEQEIPITHFGASVRVHMDDVRDFAERHRGKTSALPPHQRSR